LSQWLIASAQIIASRPKNTRRGSARRTSGRTQILGTAINSPSTRARQAVAAAAVVAKATATTAQPADKIIVSNLPQDVNEAQIKVILMRLCICRENQIHSDFARNSSTQPSAHSVK
jgi:THO complex subunit 4